MCHRNLFGSVSSDFTYTHPFSSPLSRTTRVSRYQKGKTNLDFTEARDSEWQWHQLGKSICKSVPCSRQITTPVPRHLVFFTHRMPFLPPNPQRQSTEGNYSQILFSDIFISTYIFRDVWR